MPIYGLLPNNCFLNNDYSLSRLYGFLSDTPCELWKNDSISFMTFWLIWFSDRADIVLKSVLYKACISKNYRGIIRDLLRLTVNSMFCTKLKIRIYYSSRFSQAGRLNRLFLSWNNRHVSNYDVVLFILIFLSDARCVLFLLSQRTFLSRNWQNYDYRFPGLVKSEYA